MRINMSDIVTITNKQKLSILKKVRKLLTSEDRWVKGASAENKYGKLLYNVCAKTATCWCLAGAIEKTCKESKDFRLNQMIDVIDILANEIKPSILGVEDLVIFNDDFYRTHKDIIKTLDKAIERISIRVEKDNAKKAKGKRKQ